MTKTETFYHAKNKLSRYDKATEQLMLTAMNFEDIASEKFSLSEIVFLLRRSFKERLTRKLVLNEDKMREYTDPSSGFCMYSSYLIYSMTGGNKVWELQGTNLHWWLYHKQSGAIFDVTHTQFAPKEVCEIYKLGRPVSELNKDDTFNDVLKMRAHTLAQRAGLE